MDEMIIRQAAPEDADGIYELERLCFLDPWSLDSVRYELEENPLAFYLVAEIDGQIVGYAGIWWIDDEGYITNVAVRPGFRNRRIGSQIIEALLEHTAEQGIRAWTLEVRESNDAGRALDEKFGFAVEGVRKGYYKHEKEDALIMWRREGTVPAASIGAKDSAYDEGNQ